MEHGFTDCAITFEYKDGAFNVIIKFEAIDLKKATIQGLNLLMDLCLDKEAYEWAAEIQNEINSRKLNSEQNVQESDTTGLNQGTKS